MNERISRVQKMVARHVGGYCTILDTDSLLLSIKCHSNNNCDKFEFVNDLLYFKERLYIPEYSLHFKVL